MLYPIKFKPLYKDYLWGGRNLEKFGKTLPDGIIAESWELSCEKDGLSVISNGELKGNFLLNIIKDFKNDFLGKSVNYFKNDFPLLFKIIDANSQLSIQVHPDDEYADKNENGQSGKTEMWYVVSAQPDSKIIYNFNKNLSKEKIISNLKSNNHKNLYNEIKLQQGDVVFVPSGTVHALNEGLIIAEIQQSSNLTYRLYDYDRVDISGNKRPLHLEKSLNVIKFNSNIPNLQGILKENSSYSSRLLAISKYFYVEEFIIKDCIKLYTKNQFQVLMFISGDGEIVCDNGTKDSINSIETLLIPAGINNFTIYGDLRFLKIFVPNLQSEINNLLEQGITNEQLQQFDL